jgi:hypothetical protein
MLGVKDVKKKQVPSLKKLVYESMNKDTGKPKELPILVQYQLNFQPKVQKNTKDKDMFIKVLYRK